MGQASSATEPFSNLNKKQRDKAAAKERRAEVSVQNGEIKRAAKAAKCEEKATKEAAVAAR